MKEETNKNNKKCRCAYHNQAAYDEGYKKGFQDGRVQTAKGMNDKVMKKEIDKENNKEIKKWFEANYLDGDEIQDGQMFSSATCLDVLIDYHNTILYEERKN